MAGKGQGGRHPLQSVPLSSTTALFSSLCCGNQQFLENHMDLVAGEKNSWRCDANLEQAVTISPKDWEKGFALSFCVLSVVIIFFLAV